MPKLTHTVSLIDDYGWLREIGFLSVYITAGQWDNDCAEAGGTLLVSGDSRDWKICSAIKARMDAAKMADEVIGDVLRGREAYELLLPQVSMMLFHEHVQAFLDKVELAHYVDIMEQKLSRKPDRVRSWRQEVVRWAWSGTSAETLKVLCERAHADEDARFFRAAMKLAKPKFERL